MKSLKIIIPVAVIAAAAVLIAVKESGRRPMDEPVSPAGPGRGVPTLIDLGADRCVPCIKMASILEGLKEEYRGKLEVIFIDVWQDRTAGQQYGIRLIPTQIFFDARGKELGRHEGFIGQEDILNTFRRLGVEIPAPGKEVAER
ncbi:MAG: thioredoxin family protein [Candidatus Erginobacter occultus]|nr:thioredoxin family protein [Candidatus Erginobacter occultus]